MSSNLARSTSFNFFSLSEIIQESYPHLDTDCNSSCVDIFTVDTNARMDVLCLSDVYLDTDSNSSCFGIFTVSGFLGDSILQSKLSRQKIQIKALDPIHAT